MTDKSLKYVRVTSAVLGAPWAIAEEKLDAIVEVLQLRANGIAFSPAEIQARIGTPAPRGDMYFVPLGEPSANKWDDGPQAATPQQRSRGAQGAIAVLPLYGVIAQRMSLLAESSGGCSTERFKQNFQEAVDDASIKAIVIDVDSPGGTTYGVMELAQVIYDARGSGKPIVAVVNSLCASAAIWIASQAPEMVITPGGFAGSIGVYLLHVDWSQFNEAMGVKPTYIAYGKYKTETNPDEPLGDDTVAYLQTVVDDLGAQFVSDVARGRSVPVDKVTSDFGQGRLLNAKQAVKVGMVDRIQTLDQVLARLGASAGKEVRTPEPPPPIVPPYEGHANSEAKAEPINDDEEDRSRLARLWETALTR